ncbi:prephenate dehydratase [Smaragdicoccus niigatensis]|uniref:prephenate dehydratase n=1 Tax=Smaragdicoccus niigatensis TaxID=359359 RepID=UPI0003764632|nr:prephenate dehydratase [Smaragdicoccus niigatensis]
MLRISYFGPAGTFTEMALAKFEAAGEFTDQVTRIPAKSQQAALEMVRSGSADAAVVPIESSVDGPVAATMDALAVGDRLQIVAENELDVAFSIVARPGTNLADVKVVHAYPVAAAQVQQWLTKNLPDAEVEYSASNAAAAADIAAGHGDAAVSTALAGQQNGLISLADGVADYEGARTRFVLVSKPCPPPERTGADRTSVVFGLSDEPGSLYRAFAEFATRGVDLTLAQSRPTRTTPGKYWFFIDCVGHIDDPAVAEALKALHQVAGVRYLGSWPVPGVAGRTPPSGEESAEWLAHMRAGKQEQ